MHAQAETGVENEARMALEDSFDGARGRSRTPFLERNRWQVEGSSRTVAFKKIKTFI